MYGFAECEIYLEGRMGFGIHFAMDYLTEQTQYLNGEIDEVFWLQR